MNNVAWEDVVAWLVAVIFEVVALVAIVHHTAGILNLCRLFPKTSRGFSLR